MNKNNKCYIYNINDLGFSWDEVLSQLNNEGFVVIRGLFKSDFMEENISRILHVMNSPSIGGSYGYYQKDCAKKLFDPLLLSGNIVEILVNPSIIKLVENYVDGEVVLAECNIKHDLGVNRVYFPMHTDFPIGWTQEGFDPLVLGKNTLKKPVAVGAMVYFHKTIDGAFCYSKFSQNIEKDKGNRLNDYPTKIKKMVYDNMVRVEGSCGDLVLFDDRGFHGPEQPTKSSRTVLLFDYYKLEVFGGKTKTQIPCLLSDLGDLNRKQLEVLGLGKKAILPYWAYHTRSYNKSKSYERVRKNFDKRYSRERIYKSVKEKIKILLRRCDG